MIGYRENNFRAIVKPKKVMELTTGFLIPELEYIIAKQEEPIDDPDGLKRTFIKGNGFASWIGCSVSENFDVVKVLNK